MKNVNLANLLLDLDSFFGGLPRRPFRFEADTDIEEWLPLPLPLVATIAAANAAVAGRVDAAAATDSATSGLSWLQLC